MLPQATELLGMVVVSVRFRFLAFRRNRLRLHTVSVPIIVPPVVRVLIPVVRTRTSLQFPFCRICKRVLLWVRGFAQRDMSGHTYWYAAIQFVMTGGTLRAAPICYQNMYSGVYTSTVIQLRSCELNQIA